MPTCPICSKSVTDDATACPKCHLPAVLFDAVREAVGPPTADPEYVAELNELVLALEESMPETASVVRPRSVPSVIALPARFPAPRASFAPATNPAPVARVHGLPALPEGHGPELWRKQIAEYLRLARRRGMDVTEFNERAREAVATDDSASLEVLNRDLFVHLAAGLTDDIETLQRRREELAQWSSTSTMDAELESAEASLSMGDLVGADRRLRRLSDEVGLLEEQWATIQILETEADLMRSTLVELGGDPAPVQGALDEGQRLAREGRRPEAERVLARANLALWSLLAPRLTRDLARIKELVVGQRASGGDVVESADLFREIATDLRRRNYGALVAAYRKLRTASEPVPAVASRAPEASGLEVAR